MSKEIKKHCVKWGVNPPFLSRWILTSVILVSSVIIRVFMALGSAKISQWILRSESSKFWSSTFSRRNLPNYIYEYHTFKMTGSYRPHFFFQGFVLFWNIRPPFHWMYLIRRLWILIEYPSENDFHKKWRGTWQRTVTVTQWSSHIKMFLPFHLVHPTGVSLILRLVMSGSQNSNIVFFHNYIEEKKKWQGGKKAKKTKQTKLSSHFSLLLSKRKNIS